MLSVKPAAKILFSGILPPYGISILVMVPFEYLESRKTIRIMKKSYQVGDEVGMMINAGRTEDEIRDYLSSRIIAKNRMSRWSGKNPSGGRENAVTHTPPPTRLKALIVDRIRDLAHFEREDQRRPNLYSYYVITMHMSRVLTGKVRRVGN